MFFRKLWVNDFRKKARSFCKTQTLFGRTAPFPKAEYDARLERVKHRMISKNIETIVVWSPSCMNYLTGYDSSSYHAPQCVIVNINHDEVIWWGRHIDWAATKWTTYLEDEYVKCWPEDMVNSVNCHAAENLVELIKSLGWNKGTIGVEMEDDFFTPRAAKILEAGLDKIINSDKLVNWVRVIKSDVEVEIMRQAGKIADEVLCTALENISPGVRIADAVGKIVEVQCRGVDGLCGDYSSMMPFLAVGEKAAAAHIPWCDDTFPESTGISIELTGVRKRYHVPIARTIHLGKPSKRYLEMEAIVSEALDVTKERCVEGNTAEWAAEGFQNALKKYGIDKPGRMGYSIGIGYPPVWDEQTVNLRQGDKTELKANMCFHLLGGIWLDKFGFQLSDSVVVQKEGPPEVLCTKPRKMFVVD